MRWGAGRPGYRAKAEHLQRVDIRVWHRGGYLRAGRWFTWSWSVGGDPAGSIGVRVTDAHSLRLDYMVGSGHDRRDGSQTIHLTRTPCHFGSSRPWFVCPVCHRRAGLLYLRSGRFACRHCQCVAYAVQSCDRLDALWRRQAKIESKLGEDWQRPKGMRIRTYDRAVALLVECENKREEELIRAMARLIGTSGQAR